MPEADSVAIIHMLQPILDELRLLARINSLLRGAPHKECAWHSVLAQGHLCCLEDSAFLFLFFVGRPSSAEPPLSSSLSLSSSSSAIYSSVAAPSADAHAVEGSFAGPWSPASALPALGLGRSAKLPWATSRRA